MFLSSICKNAQKVASLVLQLESVLGASAVKTSASIREQYSHDEAHHEAHLPELVVIPTSVEQVSAVVRLCNESRVPVIPFGTGTGLEGGVVQLTGGVTIDLKAMDQVLEVNDSDFDCVVQPGVTREALNDRIRETGLWFTVDPGADASVCGMIATGASGTTSVRYGTMKSNVKNLEVVLANGEILYTRGKDRRPWKSSAGYNLTDLFIGQEGTLGIITAATVGLHPRPNCISAAICGFPDAKAAVDSVVEIRQLGLPVARLEFLDEHQVSACNAFVAPKGGRQLEPLPTLFIEFHGATDSEVEQQAIAAQEVCSGNQGRAFEWSSETAEMNSLWEARHNAFYATMALKPGSRGFSTDVCVPISRLPGVLTDTRKDMEEHGLVGTIVGHVGEGNFHCIFPAHEEDMKAIWEFSDRLVHRALAVGGTCTGEHGVGIGKRDYLPKEFGPVGMEVMKTLKRTLDPNNIMNPGKVIAL